MNKPTATQITQTLKKFTTDIDNYFGNYLICLERIKAVVSLTMTDDDTIRPIKPSNITDVMECDGIPVCELTINGIRVIIQINNPLNISECVIMTAFLDDNRNGITDRLSRLLETVEGHEWELSTKLPDYPENKKVQKAFDVIMANAKYWIGQLRRSYKTQRSIIKQIINNLDDLDSFEYDNFTFTLSAKGSSVKITNDKNPEDIYDTCKNSRFMSIESGLGDTCTFDLITRKIDSMYGITNDMMITKVINILSDLKPFKKPDSDDVSWDDVEEAKNRFNKNMCQRHKELKEALNSMQNSIETDPSDDILDNHEESHDEDQHTRISEMQDQQSKELDELLNSLESM